MRCDYCNKEHNRRKFCSVECKNEYHKKNKRHKNQWSLTTNPIPDRECAFCDKTFIPTRRCNEGQRFCSSRCKINNHAQNQRDTREQIRSQTTKTCPVCDKQFIPDKSLKQKYCSKRCCYLFPKKIYKALRSCYEYMGEKKRDHTRELLGFSPRQLQEHIMSHPNWPSVKDGDWHLDHIFPIIAFLDHGIKDIALICCLENLQPLSGKGNLQKNDKYDEQEFLAWLESH